MIATNLQRLVEAKSDIAEAIVAKGGTVNSGDGFEDFPDDIATIPSGGGETVDVRTKTASLKPMYSEYQVTPTSVPYISQPKNWGVAKTTDFVGVTSNLYGRYIWSDGTNTYYSYGSTHYLLDTTLLRWSIKTWNGMTSFNGDKIWSDGTNVYYSNGSTQKVLDKSTDTWVDKTWRNLPANFDTSYIWSDGTDTYYTVDASTQKVLDKSTDTWVDKTWSNGVVVDGRYVFAHGGRIYRYYLNTGSGYYYYSYLNVSTSTWTSSSWMSYAPKFTDGTYYYDYYYDSSNATYKFYRLSVTTTSASGSQITNYSSMPSSSWSLDSRDFWTDGKNAYCFYGSKFCEFLPYAYSTSKCYLAAIAFPNTAFSISSGMRRTFWTDDNYIYYSRGTDEQYVLDTTNDIWSIAEQNVGVNVRSYDVWKDGSDIYYSREVSSGSSTVYNTYRWDDVNKLWLLSSSDGVAGLNMFTDETGGLYFNMYGNSTMTLKKYSSIIHGWEFMPAISNPPSSTSSYAPYVWTDGISTYYSNSTAQRILNKNTWSWDTKTWNGMTSFYGEYIWSDGTNTYYSNGSTQKVLDKSTSTWSDKTWNGLTNFYAAYIIRKGDQCIYIDDSGYYTLDSSSSTWTYHAVPTTRIANYIDGKYIWSDGTNTYYSNGSTQKVLDKSTDTWVDKTWNGLTAFEGYKVWSDGINIYYSTVIPSTKTPRGFKIIPQTDASYTLDKSTDTWTTKTWNGITSFDATYVWSDGTNTYYSNGSTQKVLDTTTSTWSDKTWNGLTSFEGDKVWRMGSDIYMSYTGKVALLNKMNDTWIGVDFNTYDLLNADGSSIWVDGAHINKNKGEYYWTDGTDIYFSNGSGAQFITPKYS